MKTVILAGGLGTRISEETGVRPKPMVEIGGYPILWHIMKLYAHYGFNEFVICLGYKGYTIREYFANYFLHRSNVTIDLRNNSVQVHNSTSEPWVVTLIDTGVNTMTGGRVRRVSEYLGRETFMLTYGDGVADINLNQLLEFHRAHGKLCTVTSTQPEGRFGVLRTGADHRVERFIEKPEGEGSWINAGFFVCEPGVMDYLGENPLTVFEREPLEKLAQDGQLYTYRHSGFWKCMDTLSDKMLLERLWQTNPQWKVWAD
jgi:glucose-1-phosphate cytidylyltransferase